MQQTKQTTILQRACDMLEYIEMLHRPLTSQEQEKTHRLVVEIEAVLAEETRKEVTHARKIKTKKAIH